MEVAVKRWQSERDWWSAALNRGNCGSTCSCYDILGREKEDDCVGD